MSSSDTAVPSGDTTADTEAIDAAVSAAAAAARDLTDDAAVWGVLYDHGLAWVDFPRGSGGLGVSGSLRGYARAAIEGAGLSQPDPGRNTIGFGMAAPTIVVHGTDDQRKLLRDIFTLDRIFCQLFSEPGAGSDLAAVATRAVRDGDDWRVTGQKVWTSGAQNADIAILVTRTDPDVPKHKGLTYFLIDMKQPGIETRGLRQITGESEFNEVFLDDAVVPDSRRLGDVGEGWRVANTTLNSERVSIGSGAPREGGMIGVVASAWRSSTKYRSPVLRDELLGHWVDAEVQRTSGVLLNQKLAAGRPGPEGSGRQGVLLPDRPGSVRPRPPHAGSRRSALRQLGGPPPHRLLDDGPEPRVPIPAGEGQLDRGRDDGDHPQHHRREGARPARRAPH